MSHNFSLRSFDRDPDLEDFKLSGNCIRRSNELSISLSVTGKIDRIIVPVPNEKPIRAMRLWEETCFEFFLAPMESDIGHGMPCPYWEFNLSPSGNWNVFRFVSYRDGMAEEEVYTSLPFFFEKLPGKLKFEAQVNLDKIVPPDVSFKVGISAIIKSIDGESSFWALSHPGREPDFHNPDCFLLAF